MLGKQIIDAAASLKQEYSGFSTGVSQFPSQVD